MIGKNLKIRTKLSISTGAFLVPLALMFFQLISLSRDLIQKGREELRGIECLRPAAALMRLAPQYVHLSFDRAEGAAAGPLAEEARSALEEFGGTFEKNFGPDPAYQALRERWVLISGGGRGPALEAYGRFMAELRDLTGRIGDLSGLSTAGDLESDYLASMSAEEIPAIQELLAAIGNLFRTGGLDAEKRALLERYTIQLGYSANARLRAGFEDAEEARNREDPAADPGAKPFEDTLRNYYGAQSRLSEMIDYLGSPGSRRADAEGALQDTLSQANAAAYRLQIAAMERLEALVSGRIQKHEGRLIRFLALALGAALAAFVVITATSAEIRKSASTADRVFKSLERNDLSIGVEAASRDELGELMTALGDFIEKLKGAFISFNQNASMVSTAVYDLSASAKEITTTANEQSASVAEIVSTMENSKNLSEQVAAKTGEVADLAARTQELSQRGAELRDANQEMMQGIREQNGKIIDEIRNLDDMLSRIDESVQLIDTIADQTKLLAFNAALEASSSGEAGARFAVVASEIRRFADNVVESVVEIKEKISELQDASQTLITEANNGSRQIDSGYVRMVEQKEVFERIVDISQSVATRSQQISNLSKQQELASAQIFTALKEISAGVKQFVTATASTSATADNLNSMSIELKETLAKYQTSK
jgi:methyl-accepting chemotaxis protein